MTSLLGDTISDSFSVLAEAFAERIGELKKFTYLRIEDHATELFQQDLLGLEASIRALESNISNIKQHLQQENQTIPKVEALLQACKLQSDHLQAITSNLPLHLPRIPSTTSVEGIETLHGLAACKNLSKSANFSSTSYPQTAAAQAALESRQDDAAVRRRKEVPRWYLTEAELQGVSSYMKGRLTLDKINTAVDEMATHAEANSKLLTAAKHAAAKLGGPHRKRAAELQHSVANKDGIKGYYWFLEMDLKDGIVLKMDKTGKAILTVMRHCGRLQEMRCSVEGAIALVYVLQYSTQ